LFVGGESSIKGLKDEFGVPFTNLNENMDFHFGRLNRDVLI
jgi:hypothetical protein